MLNSKKENYNPLQNTSIFWDVELSSLNKEKDKSFIISRILEEGDIEDTRWLFKNYSNEEIIDTITTSKLISKKTANFFQKILNISKPILCLNPSFQKTHKELWMK